MKAFRTILLPIFILIILSCGSDSVASGNKTVPAIYELMPGGTHFYEGNTLKGLAFLASEMSLLTAGIVLENKRDGELNIPLLFAGQIYTIEKCDYSLRKITDFYRTHTYRNRAIRYDNSPLVELMSAPFRPTVIFSPLVLCWAVLGFFDGM